MTEKLKVLDLFSGIGGFSLGLERTGGFETVAFCEIEKFPQRVLQKHWPEVPIYEDVRELSADTLQRDGIAVDVITGGFPCQDISVAGRQAGMGEGTRSGLWSECIRLISELRPKYAIFENVSGLLSGPSERRGGWFSRILCDLASVGYNAEWENIPASALGAPHRRERIWIITYPNRFGRQALSDEAAILDASTAFRNARRLSKMGNAAVWHEPRPLGVIPLELGNGLPSELGAIKAFGNAVVPQIPELIGYAIIDAEKKASRMEDAA
jgi:DNA (cytosine-5)-methyltransferase 1